jgi:hypothetical protein
MTQELVTWLIAGVLIVGFLTLAALLIVSGRRARRWRHDYDQLIATHHNMRDRYYELLSQVRSGTIKLLSDDDLDHATALREYADQLDGVDDHTAAGLRDIADELGGGDEDEDDAEARA